jgi:hypothetical protein
MKSGAYHGRVRQPCCNFTIQRSSGPMNDVQRIQPADIGPALANCDRRPDLRPMRMPFAAPFPDLVGVKREVRRPKFGEYGGAVQLPRAVAPCCLWSISRDCPSLCAFSRGLRVSASFVELIRSPAGREDPSRHRGEHS